MAIQPALVEGQTTAPARARQMLTKEHWRLLGCDPEELWRGMTYLTPRQRQRLAYLRQVAAIPPERWHRFYGPPASP